MDKSIEQVVFECTKCRSNDIFLKTFKKKSLGEVLEIKWL